MTTDRELLEKAAKAAGMCSQGEIIRDGRLLGLRIREDDNPSGYGWNPLIFDGDALQLAVKLSLSCQFTPYYSVCYAGSPMAKQFTEKTYGGACSATRRAIVRAAASLSEAA